MNGLVNIENIVGIEIGAPEKSQVEMLSLIGDALRVAFTVVTSDLLKPEERMFPRKVALRMAAAAATQTVTALFSAASVQCSLQRPPEDIEMIVETSGRMIYRCYHNPPHKWDLAGNLIP